MSCSHSAFLPMMRILAPHRVSYYCHAAWNKPGRLPTLTCTRGGHLDLAYQFYQIVRLLRTCGRTHTLFGSAAILADLYERVSDAYPTSLNRPEYVAASMQHGAMFRLIRHNRRIVSAASAAVDYENANAEMTDCTTLKAFRGRGMMRTLLRSLEQDLAHHSTGCLYSMARSASYGMNLVFHTLGYHYQRRLIKHCHIMGQLEDMNLWVKNPLDTGLDRTFRLYDLSRLLRLAGVSKAACIEPRRRTSRRDAI